MSGGGRATITVVPMRSMRGRSAALLASGLWLAGCSSFPSLDLFKPAAPKPINLQLETQPPGAEAKTSLGPGCRTPCSVPITNASGQFTVTFTLAGHQPQTVPVQVIEDQSEPSPRLAPNPAYAELETVTGSIKPKHRKKPQVAAAPVPPPPQGETQTSAALPPPGQTPAFPPSR